VVIDEEKLQTIIRRMARQIDQQVQEPRFAFNDGNLTVLKPGREGRTLDQTATVALVKSRLLAGERTAEITVSAVQPSLSSDNPAALGIVERIDTSSTSFAGSVSEKKWNIQLAAERLNGVVVPPGATFSFNKEVGPTTVEAGFKWGYGLETSKDGVHTVPSVGGGICQVATTLFHPVFWSGYPLEERFWHLYWIPAYTSRGVIGLDVTVDEDSGLDFRWTNPTNDYILIQSATDDDRVYFSLYGKKPAWKVDVDNPVIANRVPADTRPAFDEDKEMPWGQRMVVQTAREGFDVTVTRKVIPDGGGDPRTLRLQSKYQAVATLTLVGTKGKPEGIPFISDGERRASTASRDSAPSAPAPATNTNATSSSAAGTAGAASAPATGNTSATGPDTNGSAGNGIAPRPAEQPTGDAPSLRGAVALTPITRPSGGSVPVLPGAAATPAAQGRTAPNTASSAVSAPVATGAQQLSGNTLP
jgi:vancomycin resistance protein YoaR